MELRSGYKQTEAGVIPEDWDTDRLGNKTTKVGSGITPTGGVRVYKQEGRPFLRSQNVGWGNLLLDDIAFIDDNTHATFQDTEIEADDVFLNITGASIGRSAVADARVRGGNVNQHVCIIRTDQAELHPRFLNYFLLSTAGQRQIDSFQAGGNRQGLNFGQVRSFRLPLPPPIEQRAIAEALSDADAHIESLKQLIAKKSHLKQGAMQELLTGKKRLPGFEKRKGCKKTEVGIIPEDWEVKPLGCIASIATGNTPPTRDAANYGDEFLFASPVDLGFRKYITRTEKMLSKKGFSIARPFPKGSVLFVCIGSTIGKCGIASETLTSNQQINAILPSEELSSDYLYYAVSAVAPKVKSLAGEQAVPIVNKTQFSETAVPLPPTTAEQEAIGTVLSDMDAEIAALESELAKARQIKQGMMQELLTGEDSAAMSDIGKPERATQNRVTALFRDELGYRYLGDWADRDDNSNIEEGLLKAYLTRNGYTPEQISSAIYKLRTEADNHSRSLYGNNQAVYNLLRYGVPVKIEAGKVTETVHLINWREPQKNDFAIAKEVTLRGSQERRPDIVLYVNGIAISLIELKNSRISIGEGIRQSLSNQKPEFNEWFFSTVQFIFAGNDSEGLQYGTILAPEKYFLKWKEDEQDDTRFKLDKYLIKMCRKDRLIELMHDFVLFDGGIKKLPRVHQYFAINAAQQHVRNHKGGIIWHTQGSGKSIVMVLLAKWILENNPNARVAIVTDRDELDKQIERVFREVGEPIKRTNSGRDLMRQLGQATPRLVCSLVHKFGRRDIEDFEAFIKELESQPSKTVGDVFVFVDECHRTQNENGKLHRSMKAMMPNAVFIGFTGTPLLAKDRQTSFEVFGGYIHTYKFSEGVEDEVVLDLVYEARDIEQRLGSEAKIDAWFEAKTKGLNDWQKDELRKQWGTMQKVLSSRSRMDQVVNDIVFDFSVQPRLSSERGNAILVASSIHDACRYFELFQKTPLRSKCAVITSYNPQTRDITTEETGANTETEKQFIYNTYTELLKGIEAKPGTTKTETYEESAKSQFIKEPANMKILVVVDKLLTGFDAPPCTYLYIDKSMQDHGLFQAICRTNRLDSEDKDFGHIVDYKDLFKKVENAIAVYNSELDHSAGGVEPEVFVQDRLKKGQERLDNAFESLALLCEPVEPPKGELEHIHYFCGNTEIPSDLQERAPQRAALYKATVALVRSYANIADELESAGYTNADIAHIKHQLNHYLNVREIVRKASGESLDLKPYEADMRHLIDTYIEADEPRKISPFDNMSLLDLIVKTGIADAIATRLSNLKGNKDAVAETIENNVRSTIIKEHLNDPAYFEKMSELLDEIIAARKSKAVEYEEYLNHIAELAKRVEAGQADEMPASLDTPGKRALFNNLNQNEELALSIDETVKKTRPDDWRGVQPKERVIKAALYGVLQDHGEVERIFLIIKAQKEY